MAEPVVRSMLSVRDLLRQHASAMDELRRREILRTQNNPVGDYAEWLVSIALGLRLVGNSSKGFDALSADGEQRVQIKGRRITAGNPSRQLGVVRNIDANPFDMLVAVIFDEVFEVVEAVTMPLHLIATYGKYRPHVNGHVLHLSTALMNDPAVCVITDRLRAIVV
jgi:hypothetical protein